jgi:hypothetical protein
LSKYYSKRPENYRKNNHRYYYERKRKGICTRCTWREVDLSRSQVSCAHCLDKKNVADRARRAGRRASGLCIDCGAVIEPWLIEEGINTCQRHCDIRDMRNQLSNLS